MSQILPAPVSLPPESRVTTLYATTDLADAYAIELPAGASTNPEVLARFIFSRHPAWIRSLMAVRDALVAGFGLKTARRLKFGTESTEKRVGIFKIYSADQNEIVLGEDDKHLDFRLSVLCADAPSATGKRNKRRLVVSTVVHCHNVWGRIYIVLIAPFHRRVIQACLRRAARVGWPPATEA